jgi:hypothetical protein
MPPRRRNPPLPPLGPGGPPSAAIPPDQFILPRQPGETRYIYEYRRSVALYGKTPYQMRKERAQARGKTVSEARGHGILGGETESQRRNRVSREETGMSVSQLYRANALGWLEEHGYTPDTTQMSWTQLIRLEPRLRYLREYGHIENGITSWPEPDEIHLAVDLENEHSLERGWAFERIWQKYDDTIAYRQFRDVQPGRASRSEYMSIRVYVPQLAPSWWWYH